MMIHNKISQSKHHLKQRKAKITYGKAHTVREPTLLSTFCELAFENNPFVGASKHGVTTI